MELTKKTIAERNIKCQLLLKKTDPYELAVSAIIFDLCDRSGFKHLWHEIGNELQEEICSVWVECIKCAIPPQQEK